MHAVLRDAWTTVVPDMRDRHGPLPPLMLTLTVVTGLVDAFSYLVIGRVFVANMTGNVVFSGFALAGAAGFSVPAALAALAAFAAGALVGGRVAHAAHAHRGRLLHHALVLETALVLAAYVVAASTTAPYGAVERHVLISLLGLAMGIQNAAVRALAVPDLTATTVLTTTLTGLVSDSRAAGGTDGRAGRRALLALALFAGGLVGAVAALHAGAALPLLLATVLLMAGTFVTLALSRSEASWTRPL